MLRISPSLLDSFEYWRNGDFDAEREAEVYTDLLSRIRGEPVERSDAMLRGEAFHKVLETGQSTVTVENLPYTFDADSLRQITLPEGMIHEAWGELTIPELDVRMKLRADGLWGNEVHEIKTTSRISTDKYLNSVQWRAYLLAFNAQSAVYHLCKLKDNREGVWSVIDYQPIRQYAYRGMRDELVRRLREFVDFLDAEGLTEYRREAELQKA